MKVALPMFSDGATTSINTAYINYIIAAGMMPIPVFVDDNLNAKLKMCNGLLLPGGIDLDPTYYGYSNTGSYAVNPDRDLFERQLLQMFVQAHKPVLGICRGFQLIAREFVCPFTNDLQFCQHIDGHNQNNSTKTARNVRFHSVTVDSNIMYGDGNKDSRTMFVNSLHHQALCLDVKANVKHNTIKTKHYDVVISAATQFWTPKSFSSVIEGISIPELSISGVQWHPEELLDTAILQQALKRKRKKVRVMANERQQ